VTQKPPDPSLVTVPEATTRFGSLLLGCPVIDQA
jgi:hypothetical protein